MYELILERDGAIAARQRLGPQPVMLGRASTNDLVLADDTVSGRHLTAWASGDRAWVEDLNSRNGTFVNGERVRGVQSIRVGDTIRLGTTLTLVVGAADGVAAGALLAVEDPAAGVKWPIRGRRFRIGSRPDCHLRVDGPDLAATLLTDPDGVVWLGVDDDTIELRVGEPFEIAGRALVVRPLPAGVEATRDAEEPTANPAYWIEATLDGPTGPRATVRHDAGGLSHTFEGSNRAVLLYLLARQHQADGDGGIGGDDQGWCDEDSVGTGIWGRSASDRSLNVLVCRVRKELREAGFDPWFIEKRRRFIRARIAGASVS